MIQLGVNYIPTRTLGNLSNSPAYQANLIYDSYIPDKKEVKAPFNWQSIAFSLGISVPLSIGGNLLLQSSRWHPYVYPGIIGGMGLAWGIREMYSQYTAKNGFDQTKIFNQFMMGATEGISVAFGMGAARWVAQKGASLGWRVCVEGTANGALSGGLVSSVETGMEAYALNKSWDQKLQDVARVGLVSSVIGAVLGTFFFWGGSRIKLASLGKLINEKRFTSFAKLADECGVSLTGEERANLSTIGRVIMRQVNRRYDQLRSPEDKRRFLQYVVDTLNNGHTADGSLYPYITEGLVQVRGMTERQGYTHIFSDKVRQIVGLSDKVRITQKVSEQIEFILEEGEMAGELMLMAVGKQDHKLAPLYIRLVSAGNLVDDILDAPSDYQAGKRLYEAGIWFYLNAGSMAFYRLIQCLDQHPHKLQFLKGFFN